MSQQPPEHTENISDSSQNRLDGAGEPPPAGIGRLRQLQRRALPRFPGLLVALGPGVVWLAMAQGSGELIWWPWTVSKYGLTLMFLLVPACLLQYPLNYQIGQYTMLTGESVLQGLMRLNRWLALLLWLMMGVSFFWLGAFVKVSGQGIVEITGFPPANASWWPFSPSAFWAQAFMILFLIALLLSRRVYVLIERVMLAVAIVTVAGFLAACARQAVRVHVTEFLAAIVRPGWPDNFDYRNDAQGLLAALTFAGLGGFWTLFYSYWLREKGAGMSSYMGHVTSPITGKREIIPSSGFTFEETPLNVRRWRRWRRFLLIDNAIGVSGNLLTTLMTCLLAYVFLYQSGVVVSKDELIHEQARFFQELFPTAGRVLFLLVATAFLADTWLATIDSVSRVHTDFLHCYFPAARRVSYRSWYYILVCVGFVVSTVTLYFEPYDAILLMVKIGFAGTVIYSTSLLVFNHFVLPRHVAPSARPGRISLIGIAISSVAYAALGLIYLVVAAGTGR